MRIFYFIKSILNRLKKDSKKIDIKKLPSQGFFYDESFEITIRKASLETIQEYESDYDPEDLGTILYKIKKVVAENSTFSKGHSFGHIKSIDVIFIFLEIVNLTKGDYIKMEYYNDETGKNESIAFNDSNFNYFKLDEDLAEMWDRSERCFRMNGYKYTLPSIGIENSLTNFLISKSGESDALKYNSYNYSFTYFLGNKEFVTFDEIDNLIEIFNFDLDSDEMKKIDSIVERFLPMQRYSLMKNGRAIEMSSKINLQKIWR